MWVDVTIGGNDEGAKMLVVVSFGDKGRGGWRRGVSVRLPSEKGGGGGKGLICTPNYYLSNSGLEEFQQPEFDGYRPKVSKSVSKDTSDEVKKTPDAPIG
ncbi:hypothetical protein Tco_0864794, partial [Tanacetum coccineum]